MALMDTKDRRRYQLQMADKSGQKLTINSSYILKLQSLVEYLMKQGFEGRIIDLDNDGELVEQLRKKK